MKWVQEFKEFAMKGNVVDLAVGVIIGGAFGKIVSSLVGDVMMPILGILLGGINFTDFKIMLKHGVPASEGVAAIPPVTLNIGNFVQTVFDFLIIAFAIFVAVKAMNSLKRREEQAPQPPPPTPPKEEMLLTEIRDLLKVQNNRS